jgi:hypothetical protein
VERDFSDRSSVTRAVVSLVMVLIVVKRKVGRDKVVCESEPGRKWGEEE